MDYLNCWTFKGGFWSKLVSDKHRAPNIFLKLSRGALFENATVWCSGHFLEVFRTGPWKMFEWALLRNDLKDPVSTTRQTWHCKNMNTSGWRREARHVRNEDEDVNLERRRDSRAFGDKRRHRCQCAGNKTTWFLQQNLYVTFCLSCVLSRCPPSPECCRKCIWPKIVQLRSSCVKGKVRRMSRPDFPDFPRLKMVQDSYLTWSHVGMLLLHTKVLNVDRG